MSRHFKIFSRAGSLPWLLMAGLVISRAAFAGGFGSLQGVVRDAETNEPVSGAVVSVELAGGIRTLTDEQGHFIFKDLIPSGRHDLEVSHRDYQTRRIDDLKISYGSKTIQVVLCPKDSDAPQCHVVEDEQAVGKYKKQSLTWPWKKKNTARKEADKMKAHWGFLGKKKNKESNEGKDN